MFCPGCGKEAKEGAKFCNACGHKLPQTPVVEEASVTAAVPDSTRAHKKAAKAAKKAAKKKVWPWVVGILVFLLVAATAFCYFFVNPYFAKKNAYEKAVACLEAGDYDGALENFEKAGDYEDAAIYLEDLEGRENAYIAAVKDMEEGRYADAGEVFDALGSYRDAYRKAQDCLYFLAVECLGQQDIETAYNLSDKMDGDTYGKFMEAYSENFADFKVFEILEELLTQRFNAETGEEADFYAILQAEKDGLSAFEGMPAFADPDLEELISLYIEGVEAQFAVYADEGDFDETAFYEGAYNWAYAIDRLIADYDFLSEEEELRAYYEGSSVPLEAALNLQRELNKLQRDQITQGGDGKKYIPFRNTTETAALVQFQTHCYQEQVYLGAAESYLTILPGETVYIPLGLQEGCDDWYMDWYILEIYPEEDRKAETGVYKLQSMVVKGVFYDLTALEANGFTPDSVVVTFNADGTGIWKEMDIENTFSYSSSLIAIDGMDMRLSYGAAAGKLVVEVGEYTYVLTLESAAA